MVDPKDDCERDCIVVNTPLAPKPKAYVRGRSGSAHKEAEKTKDVLSSRPWEGETKKNPGVGGALVVTETDDCPV